MALTPTFDRTWQSSRARKRSTGQRLLAGACSLLQQPRRLARAAVILRHSTTGSMGRIQIIDKLSDWFGLGPELGASGGKKVEGPDSFGRNFRNSHSNLRHGQTGAAELSPRLRPGLFDGIHRTDRCPITSSRDHNGRAAQNTTRDEADPSRVRNAHPSVSRRNDQITRSIQTADYDGCDRPGHRVVEGAKTTHGTTGALS